MKDDYALRIIEKMDFLYRNWVMQHGVAFDTAFDWLVGKIKDEIYDDGSCQSDRMRKLESWLEDAEENYNYLLERDTENLKKLIDTQKKLAEAEADNKKLRSIWELKSIENAMNRARNAALEELEKWKNTWPSTTGRILVDGYPYISLGDLERKINSMREAR